jgi:hypothetical protein
MSFFACKSLSVTAALLLFQAGDSVLAAPASGELPALKQQADALGRRIELLKAHAQIEKIQRAYGYYVDKAQWPQIAALFADQGHYEIGGRGIFIGQKRVLEYLVTGLGPIGIENHQGSLLNHQQLQGIVDVAPDGRHAWGRWTAFVMGGGPNPPAVWGDVTYENEYVDDNGVWKVLKIRAPFNMYTVYPKGWGEYGTPHTRPDSFPPPPDLPPTEVSLTYPGFYVTPYHYPNPVTGKPMPPPNPAAGGVAPMADYVGKTTDPPR